MDFLLTGDKGHPLRSVEPKQQFLCLRIKAKMMVSVTGACTPGPDGNEAVSGGFCDRTSVLLHRVFQLWTWTACTACCLKCTFGSHAEASNTEKTLRWSSGTCVLDTQPRRCWCRVSRDHLWRNTALKPLSLLNQVSHSLQTALSECMFSKKMSIRVTKLPGPWSGPSTLITTVRNCDQTAANDED